MNKFKITASVKYYSAAVVSTVLGTFFLLKSVSWSPNTEADGVMFPQAVNLADGKILFRDIYEQYGVLVPFLQYPMIRIFGEYIIVLRYFGAVVIVLSLVFFYLILRIHHSRKTSFLFTILLLFSQPSWNDLSNRSWPGENIVWFNSYGVFFYLIAFYGLVRPDISNKSKMNNFRIFIVALCIFCGANARVEFVIPLMFVVTWIVFYSKYDIRIRFLFCLTLSILFLIEFSYFYFNGSLMGFTEQILEPLISGENTATVAAPLYFYFKVVFIELFVIVMLISLTLYLYRSNFNKLLKTLIFFMVFVLINFSHLFILEEPSQSNNLYSFLYLFSSKFNLSFVSLLIFGYLVLLTLFWFSNDGILGANKKSPQQMLYMFFPLTLLPTLHNLGSSYQYMIICPFIISILYLLKTNVRSFSVHVEKINDLAFSFVSSFLAMSTILFLIASYNMNYEYTYKVLTGMFERNKQTLDIIETQFEIIDKHVSTRVLSNECGAGLFSVTKSGYIVNSKFPNVVISAKQNSIKAESEFSDAVFYACGLSDTGVRALVAQDKVLILETVPYLNKTISMLYQKKTN